MSGLVRRVVPVVAVTGVLFAAALLRAQSARSDRVVESFEIGALISVPGAPTGPFPLPPALRHASYLYLDAAREPFAGAGRIPFTGEFEDSEGSQPAFVDLIRSLIAEDSWSNERNRIDRIGDHLLVVQTKGVIDSIGRFLTVLERRQERRYRLDVAFVPPSALAGTDEPWLSKGGFGRVVTAGGDESAVLSGLYRAGVTRTMMSGGGEMHFVDVEVNQTNVLPALTASVGMVPRGLFARACVHPGPDPGRCRVDLEVADVSISREIEKRRVLGSELELLTHTGEYFGTSLVVPLDRPTLVGLFDVGVGVDRDAASPGPASVAAVIRLRVVGSRDVVPGQAGVPAVIDAGLLCAPLPEREVGSSFRGAEEPEYGGYPSVLLDAEDLSHLVEGKRLVERAEALLPAGERAKGRVRLLDDALVIGVDESALGPLREGIEGLLRSHVRLVDVELWQVSVATSEPGGLLRAGSVLQPGWLGEITGDIEMRVRIVGLGDRDLHVTATRSTAGVRDVELVSGGTEKLQVVAADPIVATIGGGLELQVNVSLDPGSTSARLELRGEVARPPTTRRQSRAWASNDVDTGHDSRSDRGLAATGGAIDLDLTDEDSDSWGQLVTVPLDRAMVLRVLSDRARPGRSRALVARVSAHAYDGDAENEP